MQYKSYYLHSAKFVINCNKTLPKEGCIVQDLKLPLDFVDNYILKTKPEYAIVYLYAFRHKDEGEFAEAQSIASALNLKIGTVNDAIAYWCELGFDIFTNKKFPPKAEKSKYSAGEIAKFTSSDKELAILFEETEKIMCKVLSPNNQQTLYWIYNDLGMSSAMIILMLNYAKSKDKCNMRYIEKLAFDFSEKGIFTFEEAEEYFNGLERENSYESRLKKLFGLDRSFISTEKNIISNWCNTLKPSKEQLLKAYEICIERTGKFSVKYINAILENWKEQKTPVSTGRETVPTPKSTKFNNFQPRSNIDYKKLELEALRKRLARSRKGDIDG